jgi:hypothetical protein
MIYEMSYAQVYYGPMDYGPTRPKRNDPETKQAETTNTKHLEPDPTAPFCRPAPDLTSPDLTSTSPGPPPDLLLT